MQIVIEEEKTDNVGDEWAQDTDDEVDMHPVDFRKGHEVLSQD